MSDLKVKGKVTVILDPLSGKTKDGKDWNKQDFVIQTESEYPKAVCFTLFGDKTSLLPKVGDDVEVYFNLESREYNGKYYHNINAWRIEGGAASELPGDNLPPDPISEDQNLPF